MNDDAIQRIRHHPKFLELEHKRSRFSWGLTGLAPVPWRGESLGLGDLI